MSTTSSVISILEKIPLWKKIQKLPEEFEELKIKLSELEEKLNTSSVIKCPACGAYKYFVIETKEPRYPHLKRAGVKVRVYKCDKCEFTEEEDKYPNTGNN